MDIVNAYTGMRNAAIMGQIQMAVAKKIMDTQLMQGNAAIQLIEAASNSVSQRGDQLVAAAIGLGSNIDVYG